LKRSKINAPSGQPTLPRGDITCLNPLLDRKQPNNGVLPSKGFSPRATKGDELHLYARTEPPLLLKRGKESSNLATLLKDCGIWRDREAPLIALPARIMNTEVPLRFVGTMTTPSRSPPLGVKRSIASALSQGKS
jgi:hypothetical protein